MSFGSMNNASPTRQRLLNRLEATWRDFHDSYQGLTDKQLLQPGVVGKWSVRDLIAHVTTWEEEALKHLPLILNGQRPPRYSVVYGGIDAFNALMTEKKKNLTLAEVVQEKDLVHRRVVKLVESVPEDAIRSGSRFRRRLQLDTYGHYPIHARAIRKWCRQ